MKLVGITGGIGSGKSTATEFLIQQGYHVIDADKISREIVLPGSETLGYLVDCFGAEILEKDGNLNRRKLARIVFTDPVKKKTLEGIMHKKIIGKILEKADSLKDEEFVFLDAPLLFETGLDSKVDMVWVVDADEEIRITRVMDRDKLSRSHILDRIENQISQEEKLKRADHILDNSQSKEFLYGQINELLNKIKEN